MRSRCSNAGVRNKEGELLRRWCVENYKNIKSNEASNVSARGCTANSATVAKAPVECINLNLHCYRYKETPVGASMEDDKVPRENCEGSEDKKSDEESSAPQPSTSNGASRPTQKKKKQTKKTSRSCNIDTSENDEREGCSNFTSTPKKRRLPRKSLGAPKRGINLRKASTEELNSAKKRLDGGLNVGLSPDTSSDELSGRPVREGEVNVEGGGEIENMPEFDTTSSSIMSELRAILEEYNQNQSSPQWDSSDPDVTGFLVGLLGEQNDKLSTAFEVSDMIRNELVERAERTGARALSWDLSSFNKVGGSGTITSVWRRLKSDSLVRGCKRSLSLDSNETSDSPKKLKISLDLSGTCDLINNIELSREEEASLVASDIDLSREADVSVVASDVEDESVRDMCMNGSMHEQSGVDVILQPVVDALGINEHLGVEEILQPVDGGNGQLVVPDGQWVVPDPDDSYSDGINVSDHSSMPQLATTESNTSYGSEYISGHGSEYISGQDSGVVEEASRC